MDQVVNASVQSLELQNRRLFCLVWIVRELVVQTSLYSRNHEGHGALYNWQHGTDEQRLQYLQSYILEPLRRIVVKWSIEILKDSFGLVLIHICIDNQNEETSIKELCHEHLICDGCLLSTVRVLSDPLDEFDDNYFEDYVHCDDDEGN